MKKTAVIAVFIFVALTAVLTSCSSGKSVWKTDLDEAKSEAVEDNKDIFVFFSTDDVDGECDKLKNSIFYKNKFVKSVSSDFVLLNVDVTESEYQKTLETESNPETETAKENYSKKIDVLETYVVSSIPSFFILTKEGYVISYVSYDPALKNVSDYVNLLSTFKEKREHINELVANVENVSGLERAKAIDELVSSSEEDYKHLFIDYAREVCELDKNNEAGLLGKYDYLTAYLQARKLFRNGNAKDASDQFIYAIKKGHLSVAQIQEAYYTASQILAYSGVYDENVMKYLEDAYEMDKESTFAPTIKYTIDALNKLLSEGKNTEDKKN